jgi:trk system potassium uptake protein TrkH
MLHIGKTFRPQMVTTIRVGRQRISDETVHGIFAFVCLYVLVFAFGALAMSAMTPNLETALSGTIACLGNVGPGLGQFGPMGGFGDLFWPGKLLMSVLMILGRLELYTVLVLFVPTFWRR